jgi:ATP-dependent RNA helicase DHX33
MAINPMLAPRSGGDPLTSPSKPKSTGPAKKIVNYESSSDADEAGPSNPPRHGIANGAAGKGLNKRRNDDRLHKSGKRVKSNGQRSEDGVVDGQEDGRVSGKGKAKEDERLTREAEKLFETRKELPFYQGRREILQEIMDNETTIVRPRLQRTFGLQGH